MFAGVGINKPINLHTIMAERSEAIVLRKTGGRQNEVLSSSRLPQYDRLAALGHNEKHRNYQTYQY